MPIPVNLCTDIGGDVNDTRALAYLLRCPEYGLKMASRWRNLAAFEGHLVERLLGHQRLVDRVRRDPGLV